MNVETFVYVGHNYNDSRFFGRLSELTIGDKISITNNDRFRNLLLYI